MLIPKEMQFRREEVTEEYDRFRKYCAEDKPVAYWFNNFKMHLPSSGVIGTRRYQFENYFPQYMDKKPLFDPALGASNYSEVRMVQTNREFYVTVDEVLREEDLFDEVRNLNNVVTTLDQLYAVAYPAFFRLRDRGYKSYPDLIG